MEHWRRVGRLDNYTKDTMTLDAIAEQITSAECLNAIYACREGHPLGRDLDPEGLFRNAWMMVAPRLGHQSPEALWLEWKADQAAENAPPAPGF